MSFIYSKEKFYRIVKKRLMSEHTVIVEVLDANGEVETSFTPKMGQSFVEAAEDIGVMMPTSCCAGACFTCACRVVEWLEDVDIGLLSVPLVDIDDDQILACIGGLKDEVFSDGKFHRIVLQKLI